MGTNNRNSHSAAMRWASQVSSISFEFAIPIAGGYWLDQQWGCTPWMTIGGLFAGSLLGFFGMLQLVRDLKQ